MVQGDWRHGKAEIMDVLCNYTWITCFCIFKSGGPKDKLSLDFPGPLTSKRTGKGQFSFQSQRKAMPKNAQTNAQLYSSSLLFNMLSRLVITFLPRSKHLLISWLQPPSAVILKPTPPIKSLTVSIVSLSICHEVMGLDAMILVF